MKSEALKRAQKRYAAQGAIEERCKRHYHKTDNVCVDCCDDCRKDEDLDEIIDRMREDY